MVLTKCHSGNITLNNTNNERRGTMEGIKLRTKIEAVIAIILVLILTVIGVASVTRVITDSSDNSYTFIRNSNGNFWEANGDNIQLAIDDLSSDGGTVWVGSSVTINSPIYLKDNVQLDFQNNKITLGSNTEFVIFSDTSFAALRNAYIVPSTYQTDSIIMMYVESGSSWNDRCRYNIVENIRIVESSAYTKQHNWTGVHLKMDGDSDISLNTFEDITIYGCRNGIVLESNDNGAYANGNIFQKIMIARYINGVWFKESGTNSFESNLFEHVQLQTIGTTSDPGSGYNEPTYGVRDVTGTANHFDHCIVWDWHLADDPQYKFTITEDATDTVISLYESYKFNYEYIQDQGENTQLEMGGYLRPNIFRQSYPPSNYEDGQSMIWIDTDDGDATYLCFFWNGARKIVELT